MSVTDDYFEDVGNFFPGSNGSTNPSMEDDDLDGLEDFADLSGEQEDDELDDGLGDIGDSEGEDNFDDEEQQ